MNLKQLFDFRRRLDARSGSHRVLPEISLELTKNYFKAFTAPSPDVTATIHNSQGQIVGCAVYAVSPLYDRVYLFTIDIAQSFRRQGYGLAVLTHIAKTHGLPITTVKEVFSANSFWSAARSELATIAPMTSTLSVSEMDEEKSRWRHLQAEVDKLESVITERFLRGESYAHAVGRGLDE